MLAMVLDRCGQPLRQARVPVPRPDRGQVLVRVKACAVCRTDLHLVDGDLPDPVLPAIPGHEIIGEIVERGEEATMTQVGVKVGIPWLGRTCGMCEFCLSGRENLCGAACFTGYTLPGGYAEYTTADERYCHPLPDYCSDVELAPLLCAGLIGYRCLVKTEDSRRLGIYGFGAAAHVITQIAAHQGRSVFAFTRPGDLASQKFARRLGAVWAGDSQAQPPQPLDAAIIFAPVGELVPLALAAVKKGGIVVCGGIHMSDIPSFAYKLLWEERVLCSVANLTRQDAVEFLRLAAVVQVRPHVRTFPLTEANEALAALRSGRIHGAAVLVPE